MNVDLLPTDRTAFRRAAVRSGPEGTQEQAVLANGVKRHLHNYALSVALAG
jgi:hypothetical protein